MLDLLAVQSLLSISTPFSCNEDVAFIVVAATVQVNVGFARFACKPKAVCVAVDTGLLTSLVLSTLPNPTMSFVIPPTVPVNVRLDISAFFVPIAYCSICG